MKRQMEKSISTHLSSIVHAKPSMELTVFSWQIGSRIWNTIHLAGLIFSYYIILTYYSWCSTDWCVKWNLPYLWCLSKQMINSSLSFSVTQTHKGLYTHAHTPRTVSTVAPGPDGASSPPMTMLYKWIEPRSTGLHACFTEPQWCMGCAL